MRTLVDNQEVSFPPQVHITNPRQQKACNCVLGAAKHCVKIVADKQVQQMGKALQQFAMTTLPLAANLRQTRTKRQNRLPGRASNCCHKSCATAPTKPKDIVVHLTKEQESGQ